MPRLTPAAQATLAALDARYAPITPPDLVLPPGWDATWKAAKAAVGSAPANIAFLGDSFTFGTQSTDPIRLGWVGLLRTWLLSTAARYADYWPISASSYVTGAIAGANFPWTVNDAANATQTKFWGLGGMVYLSAGTGGALPQITFNSAMGGSTPVNVPFTACDIVYVDGRSGTFQYAVDGGAPQTVTLLNDASLKRISITGLSNTTHTITFGNQSVAGGCMLCGVVTYSGSSAGYGFARNGYYGTTAWEAYGQSGTPTDRATLWQGKWAGQNPTGAGFPTQPALAFLAYGINDNSQDFGYDAFTSTTRRIIQALRRGKKDCSIVLVGNYNGDLVNSDGTTGFGNPQDWEGYLARMRRLADDENCAFVDMHAKWGETAVASGFVTSGNGHPTDAGHADYTAIFEEFL